MNPRALAPVSTVVSKDMAEARTRVLQLYRRIARLLPQIMQSYDITDMDVNLVRQGLKNRFRHNRAISDSSLVDIIRCKGEMELQEALLGFKTKTHLIRSLDPSRDLVGHGPESLVAATSPKKAVEVSA